MASPQAYTFSSTEFRETLELAFLESSPANAHTPRRHNAHSTTHTTMTQAAHACNHSAAVLLMPSTAHATPHAPECSSRSRPRHTVTDHFAPQRPRLYAHRSPQQHLQCRYTARRKHAPDRGKKPPLTQQRSNAAHRGHTTSNDQHNNQQCNAHAHARK